MFFLYNGLLLLPRLACGPVGLWAGRTGGERAREWAGRLGRVDARVGRRDAWLQAASVGEVRVAEALLKSFSATRPSVYLTATTRAGRRLAASLEGALPGLASGTFPLDFPSAVAATLDGVQPRVFVMIETEIWPNLLRACATRGVATLVVNGRISERSFRRYRLAAPLIRSSLRTVTRVCAQTEEDAARFITLGAPAGRVEVAGNVKYDAPPPPSADRIAAFRAEVGLTPDAPLFVAGSTAEGEDRIVLDAFARLREGRPGLRLLLAPRHAIRFDTAVVEARGRGWQVRRRTGTVAGSSDADVIVLDTIGELPLAWASASAAFVGGSLVPRGGQSMIEPASCGLAPVFGPGVENFREPAARLLAAGAAFVVHDAAELAAQVGRLLDDPGGSRALGAVAARTVASASGATARCRRALEALLSESAPSPAPPDRS